MAQVQDLMMEAGKLLEIHRAILHHADDLMKEAAEIKSAGCIVMRSSHTEPSQFRC